MRVLTADEMRAIERDAMERGLATGRELMERAGRGAVRTIGAHWPDLEPGGARRAVVLCGPGNNGGDGFVVARHLHALGWRCDLYAMEGAGGADAAAMRAAWEPLGLVHRLGPGDRPSLEGAALIVDALFGTGLSRPVELAAIALLREAARADGGPRVVALDMPSGRCADSGRRIGPDAAEANLTLAFHAPKRGHYLGDAPDACGALRVVDIGLPDAGAGLPLIDAPRWETISKRGGHKYRHGHAVILGGASGKGGAARMAAQAALRIGAGLVTLVVPPEAIVENAARLDAVMLHTAGDAHALRGFLSDARLNAVGLGPGLGRGAATRAWVEAVLDGPRAAVLDADALTAFEDRPEALFDLLRPGDVLTPHDGEFARLFPDLALELSGEAATGPAASRIDAARAAARRAGAVILLKGPDSIVAAPDGRAALHAAVYGRAVPWLATAGAGDTLTGMITGLAARGLGGFEAVSAAVWLHVEAARRAGPGLIAEDLAPALPGLFRDLAAARQ